MAYTLGSKCAKNICKRTVLIQLIIKNVVTCFLEHSVDIEIFALGYFILPDLVVRVLFDTKSAVILCTYLYLFGYRYLGDGDTDRREILPFWWRYL